MKMSGRERALAAMNNQPVDRIAQYTPTVACDVASAILGRPAFTGSPTLWYEQAKAHMRGGSAFAEFSAQIDEDLIALNRAMNMDVLRYGYRYDAKPVKQLDEYRFLYGNPDGEWEIWGYDPRAMNFSRVETNIPPREVDDWPAIAKKLVASYRKSCETIKETAGVWEAKMQQRVGDEMLVVAPGGGFSVGLDEGAMMAVLLEKEAVADILDGQLELALAGLEALAGRGIRAVLGGGDMADNSGTMYSPESFYELQMPRLKKFSARARELGIHYCWRSDGNLWGITDYLFEEAGIPGFGEVDYLAGMTAAKLRQRYPKLVLWANAAGDTLRRFSPEVVYDQSMAILEGAGPTGHLFGCSNTILPGTPVENVEAMMRACDDYSKRLQK
ncbi:MAG: uroporphyrinogen decarboxylase family protein [Victivallaceae bacterium]